MTVEGDRLAGDLERLGRFDLPALRRRWRATFGKAPGANIEELMSATGWLSHTTRAALTGLRKRGFTIDREQGDGGSRYRIPVPEAKPAPARRRKQAA